MGRNKPQSQIIDASSAGVVVAVQIPTEMLAGVVAGEWAPEAAVMKHRQTGEERRCIVRDVTGEEVIAVTQRALADGKVTMGVQMLPADGSAQSKLVM